MHPLEALPQSTPESYSSLNKLSPSTLLNPVLRADGRRSSDAQPKTSYKLSLIHIRRSTPAKPTTILCPTAACRSRRSYHRHCMMGSFPSFCRPTDPHPTRPGFISALTASRYTQRLAATQPEPLFPPIHLCTLHVTARLHRSISTTPSRRAIIAMCP